MRPPRPPTSRTLLRTGIVVVIGSSVTDACLTAGCTTTQTMFSFNDSADTRAAYAAPR